MIEKKNNESTLFRKHIKQKTREAAWCCVSKAKLSTLSNLPMVVPVLAIHNGFIQAEEHFDNITMTRTRCSKICKFFLTSLILSSYVCWRALTSFCAVHRTIRLSEMKSMMESTMGSRTLYVEHIKFERNKKL